MASQNKLKIIRFLKYTFMLPKIFSEGDLV